MAWFGMTLMETRISGGAEKGRKLRSKGSKSIRPTSERVRSAIFSLIGSESVNGARVLDLYAGTGALGIEALSRGAAEAQFIEVDPMRCEYIRESVRSFGFADRSRITRGDVNRVLQRIAVRYALVFVDPPYAVDPWDAVMSGLQDRELLECGALVVAEHATSRDLADRYGGLEIWKRRRYGDSTVSIYLNGA